MHYFRSDRSGYRCRLGLPLFASLLFLNVGCVKESLVSQTGNEKLFINGKFQAEIPPGTDLPIVDADADRTPKPSTVVAFAEYLRSQGDFFMEKARQAQQPAEQRALRTQASGCYEQARLRFARVAKANPEDASARLGLARIAVAEGQFDIALNHYSEVLKLEPNNALLWSEVGMMQAKAKNWDAAVNALRKAHQLQPTNPNLRLNLGWTLARAERYEEAWQVFCPEVGEAEAYYRLAQMCHHLGRRDLARSYLNYALQRNPQLAEARNLLANLDQPAPANAHPVVPATYMQP